MSRRVSDVEGLDARSRKRTADMLRILRSLSQQLKMLKARLVAESEIERNPRPLRGRSRQQDN
jgi:hypothetical protein